MKWVLLVIIGVLAGIVDVLPMIKMKIDRYSIASAFLFHVIAAMILYFVKVDMVFWLKGGVVYLLMALPLILLVARDDKKSVLAMVVSSVVIGSLVGIIQHFVL